jgi:hypothetical protein
VKSSVDHFLCEKSIDKEITCKNWVDLFLIADNPLGVQLPVASFQLVNEDAV